MTKRLKDLGKNKTGIVTAINCSGASKRRLIDMGITPGVEVKVVRVAPLGDPIQISLRGYELSLRRSDAKDILVEI